MEIENFSPRNSKILKWIPVAALTVSSVSFLFALCVLYPWHLELSRQFADMQHACLIKENSPY